jgi:hypothetical protein
MKLFLQRLLYVIISIIWSLLLITLVLPVVLFLITGLKWGEVLDYSFYKIFGHDY